MQKEVITQLESVAAILLGNEKGCHFLLVSNASFNQGKTVIAPIDYTFYTVHTELPVSAEIWYSKSPSFSVASR